MIFPDRDIHGKIFSELEYGNPSYQQTGQDEKQPDEICFLDTNVKPSDPWDGQKNAGIYADKNGYPEDPEWGPVQIFWTGWRSFQEGQTYFGNKPEERDNQ